MQAQASVPGWFGKIPAVGDFVARRMPSGFVGPWDRWLAQVLPQAEALLGPHWAQSYLTAPIWRFALMPDVCDAQPWAGVLMPSVDAVHRSFPLTIAAPLQGMTHAAHNLLVGSDWYDCIEEIALAALQPGAAPEALDEALLELGGPLIDSAGPAETGPDADVTWRLPSVEHVNPLFRAHALAALLHSRGWRTFWWTRGRESSAAGALALPHLPDASAFAAMLSLP